MDLVELRTQHPGLYEAAFQKGADAECTRCTNLARLGAAAGVSATQLAHDIQRGASVDDVMHRYREQAGQSDATAQAFVKICAKLLIGGSAGAGSAAARSSPARDIGDLTADAFDRMMGRTPKGDAAASPSPATAPLAATPSRSGKDIGDLTADAFDRMRQSGGKLIEDLDDGRAFPVPAGDSR